MTTTRDTEESLPAAPANTSRERAHEVAEMLRAEVEPGPPPDPPDRKAVPPDNPIDPHRSVNTRLHAPAVEIDLASGEERPAPPPDSGNEPPQDDAPAALSPSPVSPRTA